MNRSFKVPIKRKKKNRHDKVSKQAKNSDGEDEIIASDDDSDSSASVCQNFLKLVLRMRMLQVLYKAEDISLFLQEKKG